MPEPIVVPLRSRRQGKALAVQKLNHAIPAFGLLLAGAQAVGEGGAQNRIRLSVDPSLPDR